MFARGYNNDLNGAWDGNDLDGTYFYVLDNGEGNMYSGSSDDALIWFTVASLEGGWALIGKRIGEFDAVALGFPTF